MAICLLLTVFVNFDKKRKIGGWKVKKPRS